MPNIHAPADIDKLITQHEDYFKANEKKSWDKARKAYNGVFEVASLVQGTKHLTSLNMVFAVAETAIASLLGSNPVIAAKPRTKKSIKKAPVCADIVNYTWDERHIRFEAGLSLVDAVLLGRAVFKTTWDADTDLADIKVCDPYSVFFDLTARRPRDIKYWLHCTPLTVDQFKKRIADKTYKRSAKLVPDRYPTYLLVDEKGAQSAREKEACWVTVWELYDIEANKVYHYVPKTGEIVLEEKLVYCPFSLFFLNHNGKNCLGLSEIQLILPQQDDINAILSQMKLITLLSIPKILFDAGVIESSEMEKALEAITGAFVPIRTNGKSTAPFNEAFFNLPLPETPASLPASLEIAQKTISIVSALAEAARGQVTGAKTATEMALIDAQLRTRLSAREGNLASALEDVAGKVLFVTSRYMKSAKLVEVTGESFKEIGIKDLKDVTVTMKLNLFNPLKSNPAVEAERFNALYPTLAADETFDSVLLRRELVHLNGLRPDLLKEQDETKDAVSPDDVKLLAQQAAMEQAALEQQAGAPVSEQVPPSPQAIQAEALRQAASAAQGVPPQM